MAARNPGLLVNPLMSALRARPEPSGWPTYPPDGETRNSASRCTFLAAEIAVELTEQCIPVFLRAIGQMCDEMLDLLARGFAEGLGAAEIYGVRLDQGGIELLVVG